MVLFVTSKWWYSVPSEMLWWVQLLPRVLTGGRQIQSCNCSSGLSFLHLKPESFLLKNKKRNTALWRIQRNSVTDNQQEASLCKYISGKESFMVWYSAYTKTKVKNAKNTGHSLTSAQISDGTLYQQLPYAAMLIILSSKSNFSTRDKRTNTDMIHP